MTPRLEARKAILLLVTGALATPLASCDGAQRKSSFDSEQEAHSIDIEMVLHRPAHHRFRCQDGREILVDFEGEGLQLRVMLELTKLPLLLTAPAQGRRYVGSRAVAKFTRDTLVVALDGELKLTCKRSLMEATL